MRIILLCMKNAIDSQTEDACVICIFDVKFFAMHSIWNRMSALNQFTFENDNILCLPRQFLVSVCFVI